MTRIVSVKTMLFLDSRVSCYSMYRQLRLNESITHREITVFHDVILLTITVIVLSVCFYSWITFNTRFNVLSIAPLQHYLHKADIVWTIIPVFILCSVGVPSLIMLYKLEWIRRVDLTYKIIRHQWYWSYRHRDATVDSYILSEPALRDLRLLDVDNRLSAPYRADIRIIVTSTDVIHAFSLPNFFVKVDAVPGRLNTSYLHSDVPRIAYRQCSEICRVNHSFIPICVEFVNWARFIENVARW